MHTESLFECYKCSVIYTCVEQQLELRERDYWQKNDFPLAKLKNYLYSGCIHGKLCIIKLCGKNCLCVKTKLCSMLRYL